MKKRSYTLKKRAEQQDVTRQRIVEAAVELHGEVGPRLASIKAIAERAGVERLTVYRHFPDQDELFEACTAKWLDAHPMPTVEQWLEPVMFEERAAGVLRDLYDYYVGTAGMWRLSWRDRADVPALERMMCKVDEYLDTMAVALRPDSADPLQRLTLRHALEFGTWDTLERLAISNPAKISLVLHWLRPAHG